MSKYFFCNENVEKKQCIITYWYDDFKNLSAKDKLGWLKFEYSNEYKHLTKEDKKGFVNKGWCYCRICEYLQHYDKYNYNKEV